MAQLPWPVDFKYIVEIVCIELLGNIGSGCNINRPKLNFASQHAFKMSSRQIKGSTKPEPIQNSAANEEIASPKLGNINPDTSFSELGVKDKQKLANLLRDFAELDILNKSLVDNLTRIENRNKLLEDENMEVKREYETNRAQKLQIEENIRASNQRNPYELELQALAHKINNVEKQLLNNTKDKVSDYTATRIVSLNSALQKLTTMLPQLIEVLSVSSQDDSKINSKSLLLAKDSKSFTTDGHTLINRSDPIMPPNSQQATNILPSNISKEQKPIYKEAATSPIIKRMNLVRPKMSTSILKANKPMKTNSTRCQCYKRHNLNCQECRRFDFPSKVEPNFNGRSREYDRNMLGGSETEIILNLKSRDGSLLFANDDSMLMSLEDLVFGMEPH